MNKKGFTLIELLAVIVILAIIALIAVPVIMNIISSARKSAFEDTAYGLISAGEMYYAQELLENGMTSDKEFIIEGGEFVGENKLEVKGSLPINGKITVTKDGKVAIAVENGAHCVTKATSESAITTTKYEGSCEYKKVANPIITTNTFCLIDGSECAVGTELVVQVNATTTNTFFVIDDAENTLTLLMNRNVDEETVAWIAKTDYLTAGGTEADYGEYGNNTTGPITALNYLERKTSSWTNISAKTYTLADDQGRYTIERTNARARMLTETEATKIKSYDWSHDNLVAPLYGYWTSTSAGNYYTALVMYVGGMVRGGYGVYSDNYFGVRPVIEIPKTII
ncbi:MAG: prepilin-type N-terminal cleavage/methylation domain-containing protein [Firmicutes bacterium]|nr:prepilin-type N-terminal cleavage/methylation domain-containing protein [Bacillota bacterium]